MAIVSVCLDQTRESQAILRPRDSVACDAPRETVGGWSSFVTEINAKLSKTVHFRGPGMSSEPTAT